jgi:hypothetical protein
MVYRPVRRVTTYKQQATCKDENAIDEGSVFHGILVIVLKSFG